MAVIPICAAATFAQWVNYLTPGIPRTKVANRTSSRKIHDPMPTHIRVPDPYGRTRFRNFQDRIYNGGTEASR
jgi:hypothetical protein